MKTKESKQNAITQKRTIALLVVLLLAWWTVNIIAQQPPCNGNPAADTSLSCWGCGLNHVGPNCACTGGVTNKEPSCGPGWCISYTPGPCGTICSRNWAEEYSCIPGTPNTNSVPYSSGTPTCNYNGTGNAGCDNMQPAGNLQWVYKTTSGDCD